MYHYKHLFIIVIFLRGVFLFPYSALGQNNDSLRFAQHSWKAKKIRKGIWWKEAHFDTLFNSHQDIHYIEIDRAMLKKLHLAAEPKLLKKTSVLARQQKALLAINAGFFDVKHGGAVHFIKVNGQTVNEGKSSALPADAVLAFSRKHITIRQLLDTNFNNHQWPNVLVAAPCLLQNGRPRLLPKDKFIDDRHPRTAIGISQDKIFLLTIDGRHEQAQGLNLHELSTILQWLGVQDAMNLDGGGSTTLYIKGQNHNGIVSHPSDNKKFDHEGERAVANIIYLK